MIATGRERAGMLLVAATYALGWIIGRQGGMIQGLRESGKRDAAIAKKPGSLKQKT